MRFRRPSGAVLVSIAIHTVVLAVFVQAIFMERPVWHLFTQPADSGSSIHRIIYTPPVAGGNETSVGSPAETEGEVPQIEQPVQQFEPITAPTTVPSSVPAGPSKDDPRRGAGSGPTTGPLVGGQGNTRGVQPRYTDERLWPNVAEGLARGPKAPPKTPAQQLDSIIGEALGRHNDSVAVANRNIRKPGDWTFEKDGQKYGIDGRFIRLGPVAIPTAILALLPLNATNNPTTTERDRRNAAMSAEISSQARNRINDAHFNRAVRAIRERKERERKEREEAENNSSSSSSSSDSDR